MYPSANLTSFRSLTKTSSMLVAGVLLAICFFVTPNANGQSSEVTGAIEGKVTNSQTNAPVSGAAVQVINLDSQVPSATKTTSFAEGYTAESFISARAARPFGP